MGAVNSSPAESSIPTLSQPYDRVEGGTRFVMARFALARDRGSGWGGWGEA